MSKTITEAQLAAGMASLGSFDGRYLSPSERAKLLFAALPEIPILTPTFLGDYEIREGEYGAKVTNVYNATANVTNQPDSANRPDGGLERETAYRLSAMLEEMALAGVVDPFDARDRAALARLGYTANKVSGAEAPNTPRTAAGRALLDSFEFDDYGQEEKVLSGILAIEAEAAAPAEARVAELELFLTDDEPYARVKKADALLRALVVKRMPGLTREERAAEFAQRKAAARAYLDGQK